MMMKIQGWVSVLSVCFVQSAGAAPFIYDPKLCYILDGFLGIYGIIITGMFIREKFFRSKVKEDGIYSDLVTGDDFRSVERGRMRRLADDPTYTHLNKRSDGEYKELPAKRDRQRKDNQVYQGLSSATRDTYNTLQMQPLHVR